MMRAGFISGLLFLAAGLLWAIYDPILARMEVGAFSASTADAAQTDEQLFQRQQGAVDALRTGLESSDGYTRIRCARLLSQLRDDACDQILLQVMSRGEMDSQSLLAGHLILTVWDRRNGPVPETAAKLLREPPDNRAAESALLVELSGVLKVHPAWAGGYMARARLHMRRNKIPAAAEDALHALRWERDHYEALVLLGRCYLALDCPEAAQERLERALEVNPRLYAQIEDDLKIARRHAAAEREQRALERRRDLPVL